MSIQPESRVTLIAFTEAWQKIPTPFRVGLVESFATMEQLTTALPAYDEVERERAALQKVIEGDQAAKTQRQAAADAAFATGEATRRSTLADLDGKVEAARQALVNLEGQRAEAEATIRQAELLRADVRSRAAAL